MVRSHSVGRLFVASAAVVAQLTAFPILAHAEPAPSPKAAAAFSEGARAFEVGDFDKAAKRWAAAYEATPTNLRHARARLMLDVALAYERKFDASGDRASLEAAKKTLEQHATLVEGAYPEAERPLERVRAVDRLARVTKKLQAPPPPSFKPQGSADAGTDDAEAVRKKLERKPKAMIAGGAVLTLVGIGGFGMLAVGMLRDNNPLAIGGAVVAIGGGIMGPVLIGFGIRRRRAALGSGRKKTAGLGFGVHSNGAQFTLGGRF